MYIKEKVSKEAVARAHNLIHNVFAEDTDGLYGSFAFLHKPPYKENPWQNKQGEYSYSHLPRNLSQKSDVFEAITSVHLKGGVNEFFSNNSKIAVVTDDEEMVKALRQKYKKKQIEISFIKTSDLEANYNAGENRRKFNRILVDNIGGVHDKEKVISNITLLAELGERKGSTILRSVNIEKNKDSANSPAYIFAHTGWDVYIPNKREEGSNIIVACY